MGKSLQFGSIRTDTDNPSAIHRQFCSIRSGCINESKIAHRHIDPSVYSHTNPIGRMIHPAGLVVFSCADFLNQMLGWTICFTIPIFIFKNR